MSRAPRILAIDDSLTIRKLLEMVIGKSSFQIDFAATGREGVERAQQSLPDMILLDYMLPDMKGSDVCTALYENEATRAVPVVIMSAKGDDVRLLFKDAPGVVDYMNKPFTPPQVRSTIASVLQRRAGLATVNGLAPNGVTANNGAVEPHGRSTANSSAMVNGTGAMHGAPPIAPPAESMQSDLPDNSVTPVGAVAPIASRPVSVKPPVIRRSYTLAQQKAGAKALYARLKNFAARNPDAKATSESPNSWISIARKMLTPDFLDGLLADFAVLLRGAQSNAGTSAASLAALSVSTVRAAESSGKLDSLQNLALERLRQRNDWPHIEAQVGPLDGAFERGEHFSTKLASFELTDIERRVLSLVGPDCSVKQMLERSGVSSAETLNVLYRLFKINLIRHRGEISKSAASANRSVMILERDLTGVQQPLADFLHQKHMTLINLNDDKDVLQRITKERPRMVVVEARDNTDSVQKLARNVRTTHPINDMTLVAIADASSQPQASALYDAGFNAVLVRPFLLLDFERLLAL